MLGLGKGRYRPVRAGTHRNGLVQRRTALYGRGGARYCTVRASWASFHVRCLHLMGTASIAEGC